MDKQQALAEIGLPEMYHHEGSEIHGPIGRIWFQAYG